MTYTIPQNAEVWQHVGFSTLTRDTALAEITSISPLRGAYGLLNIKSIIPVLRPVVAVDLEWSGSSDRVITYLTAASVLLAVVGGDADEVPAFMSWEDFVVASDIRAGGKVFPQLDQGANIRLPLRPGPRSAKYLGHTELFTQACYQVSFSEEYSPAEYGLIVGGLTLMPDEFRLNVTS